MPTVRAKMRRGGFFGEACLCAAISAVSALGARAQEIRLDVSEWERGVEVRSSSRPDMVMFLWFYEHNLFGAVKTGVHSPGSWDFRRRVNAERTRAVLLSPAMELVVNSAPDGATLSLAITNRSGYDWSAMAGIIPCFNPGLREDTETRIPKNLQLADAGRDKTYFLSNDGLTRLTSRAIHFNQKLKTAIDPLSGGGVFPFSEKWPTAPVDAEAALLIRESLDGKWVAGIAWQDFVSVQGHNPRSCMHVAVRVGPLKRGESRTVKGRIYLFEGTKEECLNRMRGTLVK